MPRRGFLWSLEISYVGTEQKIDITSKGQWQLSHVSEVVLKFWNEFW